MRRAVVRECSERRGELQGSPGRACCSVLFRARANRWYELQRDAAYSSLLDDHRHRLQPHLDTFTSLGT